MRDYAVEESLGDELVILVETALSLLLLFPAVVWAFLWLVTVSMSALVHSMASQQPDSVGSGPVRLQLSSVAETLRLQRHTAHKARI